MPIPTRSLVSAVAIIGITPLLFAACGSDGYGGSADTTAPAATTAAPAASTTAPAASAGAASAVTVSLAADANGALAFDTSTLSAKAGKVTIVMTNPSTSGMPHAIAVEGNGVDADGETAQPGGTSTVTVTLKPGTYTYYCPVRGHKAGGMTGTLTVTA